MGILNRIGIGSAEVDTILETETVQPGDAIPARVEITGGSDEQQVEDIDLAVMTRYENESDEATTYDSIAIHKTELTDGFTIEAGEERTIDAGDIEIPLSTPPTVGKTTVWIDTGLDIDWSIDPSDEDSLEVEPGPYVAAMMDAVEELGFSLRSVKNVQSGGFGSRGFVQEFEYRPSHGSQYASDLDEIELFPTRNGDSLDLAIEVDKRGVSLLESDETHHSIQVASTDVEDVRAQIGSVIDAQL
jgi:sporulation-control protein